MPANAIFLAFHPRSSAADNFCGSWETVDLLGESQPLMIFSGLADQ
jgi:hypothetical protein